MNRLTRVIWILGVICIFAGSAYANWADSLNDGALDLTTWQFPAFPQVTGTFTQTIKPGADGNHYLAFEETNSVAVGGAAFGAGFGSEEKFRDVRVGAVVNVAGDASHNYQGLIARASYFIDPDGSMTGVAPGVVANCYILHVNYEDGPANLRIDLEKVIMNQNIMDEDIEALVPGLEHARSYYAELDVVGSGPVYVTGSLYEFKGGPLVARTPTMIDTNANDWWEDEGVNDEVFTEGISGIFAQNEQEEPAGFYVTWDDIFSASDGPAAVVPSPTNGATGVSIMTDLSWQEAEFATGRNLWLGTGDADLQLMDPAPGGTSYDPGTLEFNTTYSWRVDQAGPGGDVVGHTWQFTTADYLPVDNFESYADSQEIAATWVHNIGPDYDYVFLETGTVRQGAKAMRFEFQNQYEPFMTEAIRTFEEPQDWTILNLGSLALDFRGRDDNMEHPMFVRVEDAAGNQATAEHPFVYAVQSRPWRSWTMIDLAEFAAAGVDLTAVAKLTIGAGNGTTSGQETEDVDTLYIDNIRLYPKPAE